MKKTVDTIQKKRDKKEVSDALKLSNNITKLVPSKAIKNISNPAGSIVTNKRTVKQKELKLNSVLNLTLKSNNISPMLSKPRKENLILDEARAALN